MSGFQREPEPARRASARSDGTGVGRSGFIRAALEPDRAMDMRLKACPFQHKT